VAAELPTVGAAATPRGPFATAYPLDQKQDQRPRGSAPADPDLRAVVAAWPSLPTAIRHGIVAMIRTFRPAAGNASTPGPRAAETPHHEPRPAGAQEDTP